MSANPYAPDAVIAQVATRNRPGGMIETKKWADPEGWRGRHMWTGVITTYPPVPPKFLPDGKGRLKRVDPPAHLARERQAPNVVFVPKHSDYLAHLNHRDPAQRWTDAKDMPREVVEMIRDCYPPHERTPVQRALLAAHGITDAPPKTKAPVVVAEDATPRRDTGRRTAGAAPTKRRKK